MRASCIRARTSSCSTSEALLHHWDGHSQSDNQWADANFISFLKVACQTDVTAARSQLTYDYFQRELADQQQDRDQMAKAFENIIKGMGN